MAEVAVTAGIGRLVAAASPIGPLSIGRTKDRIGAWAARMAASMMAVSTVVVAASLMAATTAISRDLAADVAAVVAA